MDQILTVRGLRVWFPVRLGLVAALTGKKQKNVRAVDDVSFDVTRGEVLCLVGESGCGKTTTGKAALRLLDATRGNILLDVSPEDQERLAAIDRRLEELQPVLAAPPSPAARAAWRSLQGMRRRVLDVLYPWPLVSARLRRERLQRSIRFLEERLELLRDQPEVALGRTLKKARERSALVRAYGPWFTARRAARRKRAQDQLKDAKYRLRRAEVTAQRTAKPARRVRKFERAAKKFEAHVQASAAETARAADALDAKVAAKQARLAALEMQALTKDLIPLRKELGLMEALERRFTSEAERELPGLSRDMGVLRAKGGPLLEAFELQALRKEITDRYDIANWSSGRTRELRKRMQIIYQDPYESLNPKMSIFDIVSEPLLANKIVGSPAEAEAVVHRALEDVGLRPAEEYMFRYPHELSGGQRQRVGIATALVVDPDFIVADEPVSMLDASVRTEILALLLDLKKRRSLTYLFITHDLGLAWIIADRVAVMYLGKIVEMGDGPEVIRNPRHPYTKALLSVVPSPNPEIHREKIILKGERPNPVEIPAGCRFHPRCPNAVGMCGWDSQEVQEELTKLFREDHASPEAAGAAGVRAVDARHVRVDTTDPAALKEYLRTRIRSVALGRPPLGAIESLDIVDGGLQVQVHAPVEPPLRSMDGGVAVACLRSDLAAAPHAAPAG